MFLGFKHKDELRCIQITRSWEWGKCVLASSDMENIQILLVYYIQSCR